jgi:hypothetical protein
MDGNVTARSKRWYGGPPLTEEQKVEFRKQFYDDLEKERLGNRPRIFYVD